MRSSTMKTISVSLLVAALVLFPADGLRALGLGEARVDSYLGQTLDVSIRLIEPDGGALDSLTVASASGEDYDRLGIPSTALALGLDVSVDRRVDPPLIRVRSTREVIDPVVQILVDARWSSGRVLREYTLFLDPPTLPVAPPIRRVDEVSEPARPESRPVAEPTIIAEPEPAPRPAPAPTPEPEPEIEPVEEPVMEPAAQPREPIARPVEPATPSMSSRTVGPVAAGQTLWSIAYAWRPSSGLTMNQVMLAILDRNPQAFIGGNVNQLRRDAMLEMPTSDEMANIAPAEADRRMRAQMQAWQPGTAVADVPVISDDAVPEVMAESELDPIEEVDDTEYRLEVVPPEGEVAEEVPAVSEVEVARATSRLIDLEDQFYAEGLENDELYRQVEEIRDAIESRDLAGMAVANEELANLEARLREGREARALEEQLAAQAAAAEAEEAPADEVDEYFQELEGELGLAEQEASESGDAADSDPAMAEMDEMAAVESESEPAAADTADAGVVEDSESASTMPVTRTARDEGMPSWVYILVLGGLALIAGAAYYLFGIRRKSSDEAPRSEPGLSVDAARERVIEQRGDLDAHLALLSVLADSGDEDAFSDALDGMYAEVDDDDDPRWQEALNLAVLNAPDHPLLTPRETGMADDDADEGLDDKTREMLGILDEKDEEPNASETVDDYQIDSSLDLAETDRASEEDREAEDFFASMDDDEDDKESEEDEFTAASTDTIVLGDADMDLADLSGRIDEDAELDLGTKAPDLNESAELEAGGFDFSEEEDALSDDAPEDPILQADDGEDDLSLDFEFSGSDESDADNEELVAGGLDDDKASPADTLDLSNQSASNDTLRMDPDEVQALSESADAAREGAPETVRADDTLDLVSQDMDFEDVGDRELEAFLAEGDEADEGEGSGAGSEGDEPSILDVDDDEGEVDLSDEDADVKLDLARAYISMDDPESARTLLEEIVSGASSGKRSQARELLDGL